MARLEQLAYQKTDNPIIVAKFTHPSAPGAWYLSDYSPNLCMVTMYYMAEQPEDDEWMDILIMELESVGCPPFWGPLKRDMNFTERKFSELEKEKRIHMPMKK
jgi:hypothetical protein